MSIFNISGDIYGHIGSKNDYEANNEYYRKVIQNDFNGSDSTLEFLSGGSVRSESTLNEQVHKDSTGGYASLPPTSPLSPQSLKLQTLRLEFRQDKVGEGHIANLDLNEKRQYNSKGNYEVKDISNFDPTNEEYSSESDRRLIGNLRREQNGPQGHYRHHHHRLPQKQQQQQQQQVCRNQEVHHESGEKESHQQIYFQQHKQDESYPSSYERRDLMTERENVTASSKSVKREEFTTPQSYDRNYSHENVEIFPDENPNTPAYVQVKFNGNNAPPFSSVSTDKLRQINVTTESLKSFLLNASLDLRGVVDFLQGIERHVEEEADLDSKVSNTLLFLFFSSVFYLFSCVFPAFIIYFNFVKHSLILFLSAFFFPLFSKFYILQSILFQAQIFLRNQNLHRPVISMTSNVNLKKTDEVRRESFCRYFN